MAPRGALAIESPAPLERWDSPSPLAELLSGRATVAPDRTALISARCDTSRTWAALVEQARLVDLRLTAAGALPGSVVGLALSDPVELATALLGVIASRRWAAPVDPGAPGPARTRTWRPMHLAAVVVDGQPSGPDAAEGPRIDTIPGHDGLPVVPAEIRHAGGVLLSSSGTTGTPKLVALDQGRLLHTADGVAHHHRLAPEDRGYNPLPLFHVNAEVVALLATVVAGASLVLDDRFHRRRFWEVIGAHGVTWVNAVPAIIARLCQPDPEGPDEPALARARHTVRFVRSASAPLAVPVLERFEGCTGIPVVETYGMTEAASQICANPVDGGGPRGSVGRAVGVELRVRHDGRSCAAGEVGSIEIRGAGVIRQYCTPADNGRIDPEGWLITGDLGSMDADGNVFLAGRSDDVINRGGEKIVPREVEEVLATEPALDAVAVVGQPDPVLGQVPVAFVTLQPGHDGDPARVLERLRERCTRALPPPKRPVSYRAVAAMPAGATGKVQRRRLSELDGSAFLAELPTS